MGGSILEGYIIYYNKEKQRGAIYCKDNKAKYIFNATNMYDKNISVGDIVTFNIASKKNKDFFQLACNVTVKKNMKIAVITKYGVYHVVNKLFLR